MAKFAIGHRMVGDREPCFIVAEIGANHDGDPDLAREMIRVAADCGADAVKFQTYCMEPLVADADRVVTWGSPGRENQEMIGEMFERLALPAEAHLELFRYAASLGLEAFSTPFSLVEARFLHALGVPCFKVAASDVSYFDLLAELAKFQRPVILSLGKCTLAEAVASVQFLTDRGCISLALLHCIASYPAPIDEMNLRAIATLKALYPQHVVGLSDHSGGVTASLGAVAFGAKIIEKHFTLDRSREGPDHWFSCGPSEMRELVSEVRRLEVALGDGHIGIQPSERDERRTSTRSLVLTRSTEAGEALAESDITVIRPGWGIHPADKEKVIGMRLTASLAAGTVLTWDHFR